MRLSKDKIKILQARRQMRQGEVADAAGISRATLSYVMNGKECHPVMAGKIAKALEVDVTEILE